MRMTLFVLLSSALLAMPLGAAPPPNARPPAPPAAPPKGKGRFMGPHPLAGHPGAGYCFIEVPHVHDYLPDRPALYQQAGDSYTFTGDPVPFGYEGEKTVFYGHHPVPPPAESDLEAPPAPTFCFMKGPHYHDYPQPEGPGYKTKDNVVFYVGPIPPAAAAIRPQIEKALEAEYRPYVAQRPQVVVTPPPEWPGVVWVAPKAPEVVAVPPAAPAVVVAGPAPTVVVTPPAPPAVIIGAPAPGVIYFEGPGHPKGWEKGWEKGWDKGWEKGWHKGWGGPKGHWKH